VAKFVNPRQVRDVGGLATGKLAKTDRIDAAVLAHFFAEAVRPEPRPLADESTPANSRPWCSGGARSWP